MNNPRQELPEYIKKSIRTRLLDQISTDIIDQSEFELFDWYSTETELVLEQMLSSELTYIHEQITKGNPKVNDSGMIPVNYFAKRIRYSHVIYLVSLLESCLEEACSKLINVVGYEITPFGPTELKGDQWTKRRKFLERYGNLKISKELWSEPNMLYYIRNCLVHENGSTTNISEEKLEEIKKRPGVNIDGHEFSIEKEYIQHSLNALRSLVKTIEKEVGKVIQKHKDSQSAL